MRMLLRCGSHRSSHLRSKVNALRELQSVSGEELSVFDKAFKGEL